MNLKLLTNDTLLTRTSRLAETERRVTTQVLLCLLEIERRRLFLELGFSSLFDYCVRSLKYSESAAYRRISAMRLLRDVPEVKDKIQAGELSVSTACQVQSFCTSAKRQRNKVFTPEEKVKLINEVQSKSARACEKILADKTPQAIPTEKMRAISSSQIEIRFVADTALMEAFTRIRELSAHKLGGATDYATLFKMMTEVVLSKVDPERRKIPNPHPASAVKKATPEAKPELMLKVTQEIAPEVKIGQQSKIRPTSAPTAVRTRYIPAKVRQEVWRRDQGQCTFVSVESGRRCESRYGLEFDHIKPFALKGESTAKNLRLCCRQHNSLYAIRSFGVQHMAQFIAGS